MYLSIIISNIYSARYTFNQYNLISVISSSGDKVSINDLIDRLYRIYHRALT